MSASPHETAVVYGPADMLCDMNMCRLFGVPASGAVPPHAVVEFGLPAMIGQGRVDIRRCLQMCRASVLGFPSNRTSAKQFAGRSVFITPIELRLQ